MRRSPAAAQEAKVACTCCVLGARVSADSHRRQGLGVAAGDWALLLSPPGPGDPPHC